MQACPRAITDQTSDHNFAAINSNRPVFIADLSSDFLRKGAWIGGFIQRWLNIADIQIQTASGSASAEMTIEGLIDHAMLRDYLYQRMRGLKEPHAAASTPLHHGDAADARTSDAILREILDEVRATRRALEAKGD